MEHLLLLPKRLLWYSKRTRFKVGSISPLPILFVVLLTILALLFLNASAPQRRDLHLPDEDIPGAWQDNPELIAYIKQLHIHPPTWTEYNLEDSGIEDPSQNGQGKLIGKVFKEKRSGTFLEAGAYNGEEYSNTLYLERSLGWTGLLVEPDPWNFWALKKRNRKSHSIQCCLSPFPYPREVSFKQSDTMGHIVADSKDPKRKGIFTRVKCFPLYSLMLAQNLTKLDLLSLDIEGKEMQVLKTIPWDKVDIGSILIEFTHIPEGKKYLTRFLRTKNYFLETSVGEDLLFVKRKRSQ